MKKWHLVVAGVIGLQLVSGCSDAESSEQAVVGTIALSNSAQSDNATVQLTKTVECKKDSTFG